MTAHLLPCIYLPVCRQIRAPSILFIVAGWIGTLFGDLTVGNGNIAGDSLIDRDLEQFAHFKGLSEGDRSGSSYSLERHVPVIADQSSSAYPLKAQ